MRLNKIILLLFITFLLSGCTVTYNLDISDSGYEEKINIVGSVDENFVEYSIPSFWGIIDFEDVNASFLEKSKGVEYYNSKFWKEDNLLKLDYQYKFDENNFKNSNLANFSYNTFIVKKYDYDDDGINDYFILTTDNKFNIFDRFSKIESVTINIKCYYEVISSNADEVNKNVYTWYLNRNDIKPINMVYNPDKVIDYRNLWEKIKEGEYTNIFTISILLFIVGMILYLGLKRKSKNRDKI